MRGHDSTDIFCRFGVLFASAMILASVHHVSQTKNLYKKKDIKRELKEETKKETVCTC